MLLFQVTPRTECVDIAALAEDLVREDGLSSLLVLSSSGSRRRRRRLDCGRDGREVVVCKVGVVQEGHELA